MQGGASNRITWSIAAACVALLPAMGAGLGAGRLIRGFGGSGIAGIGTVLQLLHDANGGVRIGTILGAVLASILLLKARRTTALPAMVAIVIAPAAAAPTLLLWITESAIVRVLRGGVGVEQASPRISSLLLVTIGAAILAGVAALLAVGITEARARRGTGARPSSRPAAWWAAIAILLLGLAIAFHLRSVTFAHVARVGFF